MPRPPNQRDIVASAATNQGMAIAEPEGCAESRAKWFNLIMWAVKGTYTRFVSCGFATCYEHSEEVELHFPMAVGNSGLSGLYGTKEAVLRDAGVFFKFEDY